MTSCLGWASEFQHTQMDPNIFPLLCWAVSSSFWGTRNIQTGKLEKEQEFFLSGIFCFIVTKSQPVPLFKICCRVVLASEIFNSEYESILRKRHTHTKGVLSTLLSLVIVQCSEANGTGLQPCNLHLGKCLECQGQAYISLLLITNPAKTKKL